MSTVYKTFADQTNRVLHNSPACGRINANRKPVPCPVCGKGSVAYLLPTTALKDLPVKCKRCGAESVLNIPVVPVP